MEAVRRINVIKKMMAEGMTLEDIRNSFVFLKNHIDTLDREISEILDSMAFQLSRRPGTEKLDKQLSVLRVRASEWVRDVERLGSALTVRHNDVVLG